MLLYKTRSVMEIKNDFNETLKISQEITLEDCSKIKWSNRFITAILRVFSPLM